MVTSSSSKSSSSNSSYHDQILSMFWELIAGGMSGAFARTVTAPIERVKLILQLQGSSSSSSSSKTTTTASSAWEVCRQIYFEEGILAFWRGNLQNVIRAAGQAALNFALMDYYKQWASSIVRQRQTSSADQTSLRVSNFLASFLAGGLAGGTVTTVLYPTEFLRTRLALEMGPRSNGPKGRSYQGMWGITTHIWHSDGIRGFYKGYGISLAGSVLYRLLYLGGYDALKNEWNFLKMQQQQQQEQQELPPLHGDSSIPSNISMTWTERIALAQFVSLSAGTVCYPIDSVRRRMMMQAGKPVEEQLYNNSLECFEHVWKKEGVRGFFLGFGPNIFRSIGGALALVAYDGFKAMLVTK